MSVGMDDDADCVEHVWRLRGVDLTADGSFKEYECAQPGCDAVVLTQPPKTWRHEAAGL